MKRFILFVIFQTLFSLYAQDYKLFNPEAIYLYSPDKAYDVGCYRCQEEKYLKGVYLSTPIVNENDTTYFFHNEFEYPTVYNTSYPEACVSFSGSWLGQKLVLNDTSNLIISKSDTLFFKNNTISGDSWRFYNIAGGGFLEAEIKSHDYLSFLGINDSVKIIKLSRYDSDSVLIPSLFDEHQLILSKNHGLLSLFAFNLMEDFLSDSIPLKFNIFYYSNNSEDADLLTLADIYDFDIGDEFHYVISEHEDGVFDSGEPLYMIKKVIAKEYLSDSISYTFQIDSKAVIFSWEPEPHYFTNIQHYTSSVTYGNLDSVIIGNNSEMVLPFEVFYEGNDSSSVLNYGMYKSDQKYNSRLVIEDPIFYFFKDGYDTCYYDPFENLYIDLRRIILIQGCGQLNYMEASYEGWYRYYFESLAFFKKGEETWGTPLSIPDNISRMEVNITEVYPNPTTGILNLRFNSITNSNVKILVYNLFGKVFYQQANPTDEMEIQLDLSLLPNGIYLLKVENDPKILSYKIIINK